MNWDNIEGNWDQMKGKIRETWGKLTDDDLTVIKGKREQLTGRLQDRYGYLKDRADSEIDNFLASFEGQDRSRASQQNSCSSMSKKDDCCN